jgi:hypothetical protein
LLFVFVFHRADSLAASAACCRLMSSEICRRFATAIRTARGPGVSSRELLFAGADPVENDSHYGEESDTEQTVSAFAERSYERFF